MNNQRKELSNMSLVLQEIILKKRKKKKIVSKEGENDLLGVTS